MGEKNGEPALERHLGGTWKITKVLWKWPVRCHGRPPLEGSKGNDQASGHFWGNLFCLVRRTSKDIHKLQAGTPLLLSANVDIFRPGRHQPGLRSVEVVKATRGHSCAALSCSWEASRWLSMSSTVQVTARPRKLHRTSLSVSKLETLPIENC